MPVCPNSNRGAGACVWRSRKSATPRRCLMCSSSHDYRRSQGRQAGVVSTSVDDDITHDVIHDASAESDTDDARSPAADDPTSDQIPSAGERPGGTGGRWARVIAYGLLPAVAFMLAGGAGYLKWQYDSARAASAARSQSVSAATESTIALLSYQPDTVDKQLNAARN